MKFLVSQPQPTEQTNVLRLVETPLGVIVMIQHYKILAFSNKSEKVYRYRNVPHDFGLKLDSLGRVELDVKETWPV